MDINFDFRGEHPKRILVIDDDEAYAEMIPVTVTSLVVSRETSLLGVSRIASLIGRIFSCG